MSRNSTLGTTSYAKSGNFSIVGIGASAGGIQALKEFFGAVDIRSGMAYIVILHLSPDHDSGINKKSFQRRLKVIQV
jgi:chemotaxis response regulator CheB